MPYHLMYMSTSNAPFSEEEIRELLVKAREKNASLGITGLLLYVGGNFIQYLEGDQQAVESLYETIDADPRHFGLMVVSRGDTGERLFADWSMGQRTVEPTDSDYEGLFQLSENGLNDRLSASGREEILVFLRQFLRGTMR